MQVCEVLYCWWQGELLVLTAHIGLKGNDNYTVKLDNIIIVSQLWRMILWNSSFTLWTVVLFFVLIDKNILIRLSKVEKILKGSPDLIPSCSLSVKIQIMGRKVCLRRKGKSLLGIVNKLFVFKSLLTTPSNVLPLHISHNLNFHWRWRWWDQIQATF